MTPLLLFLHAIINSFKGPHLSMALLPLTDTLNIPMIRAKKNGEKKVVREKIEDLILVHGSLSGISFTKTY